MSQYFWPESFRINEVAQSLRDAGCQVSVLTGQPNYPEGEVFPGYRAWSIDREEYANLQIYRVPLIPRRRANAWRLVMNYLSFVVAATVVGPCLLRGKRFDVIFVYAISPILQAVPGVLLRRTTGGALVTWVQDLWPKSLEVTGFVRNPRLLALVSSLVRWIYRRSDLLLVQSLGFVPFVADMAGDTPVEYHPNPGELAFSQDSQRFPALQLEPGFNVVFAGNLGTVQALETVLTAARLLQDMPDVRFTLIGSGSREVWLKQELRRMGLSNVQMPGRFPPDDMPAILEQASALLVTLARNEIMSETVPSKIQAYLAVGRPIIASIDGEGARIVSAAKAGLTCPAEDAVALASAVRNLYGTPENERQRMGANGRAFYAQHYEPGLLAQRLKQRFDELIASRNDAANS